jgi:hypothetical protein
VPGSKPLSEAITLVTAASYDLGWKEALAHLARDTSMEEELVKTAKMARERREEALRVLAAELAAQGYRP